MILQFNLIMENFGSRWGGGAGEGDLSKLVWSYMYVIYRGICLQNKLEDMVPYNSMYFCENGGAICLDSNPESCQGSKKK